jgi:microcystin-dependent protein
MTSKVGRKILELSESPGTRLVYGVAASSSTVYVEGSTTAVTVPALGSMAMETDDYVAMVRVGPDLLAIGVVGSIGTGSAYAVGELKDFATLGAMPSGFVVADGSTLNRVTYSALFAKIDTEWGVGDGSTTFGIPNLIGKMTRGALANGTDAGDTGGSANAVNIAHNHTQNQHTHVQPTHFHGDGSLKIDTSTYFGAGQGFVYSDAGATLTVGAGPTYGMDIYTSDLNVVGNTANKIATNNNTTPTNIASGVSGTDKNLPPYAKVIKALYTGVH